MNRICFARSRGYSGPDGLLDLEEEVRLGPHRLGRPEARPELRVVVVAKAAARPGAGLDEHLVAVVDEGMDAGRRERDALLAGLDLLRHADDHREPLLHVAVGLAGSWYSSPVARGDIGRPGYAEWPAPSSRANASASATYFGARTALNTACAAFTRVAAAS